MTKKEYIKRFGIPLNDDFLRATCKTIGAVGHTQCGICRKHKKPRFMCGCLAIKAKYHYDYIKQFKADNYSKIPQAQHYAKKI